MTPGLSNEWKRTVSIWDGGPEGGRTTPPGRWIGCSGCGYAAWKELRYGGTLIQREAIDQDLRVGWALHECDDYPPEGDTDE